MLCQESLKAGPEDEVEQIITVGKHVENARPSSLYCPFSFSPGDRKYRDAPNSSIGKPFEEPHLLFFTLDLFSTDDISQYGTTL